MTSRTITLASLLPWLAVSCSGPNGARAGGDASIDATASHSGSVGSGSPTGSGSVSASGNGKVAGGGSTGNSGGGSGDGGMSSSSEGAPDDASPADASTDADTSNVPTGDAIAGDASTDSGCLLGSVTFRLGASPEADAAYCAVSWNPDTGTLWLTLQSADGGPVPIAVPASLPMCSECGGGGGPIGSGCSGLSGNAGTGLSLVWDGTVMSRSTCTIPPNTFDCYDSACAPAGHYLAHMCASSPPFSSPATCVDVPFSYPTGDTIEGALP
jgi:hypothetical protein